MVGGARAASSAHGLHTSVRTVPVPSSSLYTTLVSTAHLVPSADVTQHVSLTKTPRASATCTRDMATYACPCENAGRRRSRRARSSVWPWLRLIVRPTRERAAAAATLRRVVRDRALRAVRVVDGAHELAVVLVGGGEHVVQVGRRAHHPCERKGRRHALSASPAWILQNDQAPGGGAGRRADGRSEQRQAQ